MSFDIDGARKAGYSDEDIAKHLSSSRGFDRDGALKAGYSDEDIIGHLSAKDVSEKGEGKTQEPEPARQQYDETKPPAFGGPPRSVYENIQAGAKEVTGSRILPDLAKLLRPGATPEEQLSEILHYRPTPERFLARVPATVGYGARKLFGKGEPAPLDEVLARYPNVPTGVGAFIPPVPLLLPFRNKLQQRDLARAQQKVLQEKKTTPGSILTSVPEAAEFGSVFAPMVFASMLLEAVANELFKRLGIPTPETAEGEPLPETIVEMGKEFVAPHTKAVKEGSVKPVLEHWFDNPEMALIEMGGPLAAVLGFRAGAKSRKAGKRAAEEAKLREGDAEVYREGPTPEAPPEAPAYTRVPPEQRRTKVPAEPGFGHEFTRRSQPQPAGPFQPWEAGMRPVEPALPVPQKALPPAREAPRPGLPSGPEPPLQLQAGPRAPAELLPGQPFTRRPISPEASVGGLLPPAAPAELVPPPIAAIPKKIPKKMEVPRDQKGEVRLEREVGEGQAPGGAVPVQGAGPQAPTAGGVPQAPKGRKVVAREPQRPVAVPREVQPGMEPAGKAVVREKSKPAPKAKEPWEMTYDQLKDATNPADKAGLETARPLLAKVFPEYAKVDYRDFTKDPWGIGRAISTGTELPRVPTTDLSKRHRASISSALREGKPVPPEVLADYPDLTKPAPVAPPKPVEAKAKPKKVLLSDVKRAEAEWASDSIRYGENNMQTSQSMAKYMDLKKRWDEQKPKKGKLAAKLTEEKGAITLPKKRTDVEKRFENAYKRMKNAKPADAKPAAVRAAAQAANMKPEAQEPFARAVEMEAEGRPAKEVLQAAGEAIEADLFTPIKTSPLSKASVAYIKTRDFSKMIDEMPEAGPLKGADALEDAGRLKNADYRGQPGIASLEPVAGSVARAIRQGKKVPRAEPGVRETGFYVHESFMDAIKEAKDIKRDMGQTMPPEVWAQAFDVKHFGPLREHVMTPAFDTIRARMLWQTDLKTAVQNLAEKYDLFSLQAQKQAFLAKHGKLEPGKVPENVSKFNEELTAITDRIWKEQNDARVRRGEDPIPYRKNWIHWAMEQKLRDSLFGRRTTVKELTSTPGYYDTIQPNRPINPMEKRRVKDFEAYEKNPRVLQVLNDVIDLASRDIFNTNIIQNNKIHAKALESAGFVNTATALMDWTSEAFAGKKHPSDVMVSKLGAFGEVPAGIQRWAKNRLMETIFPLNFRWLAKTQWTSLNMMAARVGYTNQLRGLKVFTDPKLNKIVKDTYAFVMKSGTAVAPEIAAFRQTVSDFPKLSQPGKWSATAQKANFMMKAAEEVLVRHAIASGYFKGKQMGLKGRSLLEYASDTGARAHSMYNMENLPGVLRSDILKSSFPLQTFSFEAMNHLREIATGRGAFHGKSPATRFFDFSKMVAQIYATNMLTDYLLGAHAWGPLAFVPYGSIVSSATGLSTDRYKFGDQHIPTLPRLTRNTIKALRDVYDGQPAFKTLRTYFNRNFMIGGQTIETTLQGIEAAQRGAVLDRAGRVKYRVKGDEALKAIMMGPSATAGGQEYREEDDDKTFVEKLLGAKSSKKKRGSKGTKPTGGTSGTKPTGG